VAQVLSHASGVSYVSEPDNESFNPFALKAKFGLGRFPVLEDGDRAPENYELLWERVFAGFQHSRVPQVVVQQLNRGKRAMRELWHAMCAPRPRLSVRLRLLTSWARPPSSRVDGRVLVKSVYAPLAVEWLGERFRPDVVVVRRHPMNVVASWTELGWGGCELVNNPTVRRRFGERWGLPELGAETSALERVSWEVGLFTSALEAAADRHPEWTVASHESLCLEPEDGFQRMYDQLGFEWTDQTDQFLDLSNRSGVGYSTFRVASEQPERWRQRLTPEQVKEAWSVLSRFRAPWVNQVARDVE
jgi:hypothetical protein